MQNAIGVRDEAALLRIEIRRLGARAVTDPDNDVPDPTRRYTILARRSSTGWATGDRKARLIAVLLVCHSASKRTPFWSAPLGVDSLGSRN